MSIKTNELQIKNIFIALKRRVWLIVLMTLVIGGAGLFYTLSNPSVPIYEASSSIIISEERANMNTIKVFVKERVVLEEVSNELDLGKTANQLGQQITAQDIEGSQIVQISVEDSSPENAVSIANTLASIFPDVVEERLGYSDIGILSEATLAESETPIYTPGYNLVYFSLLLGAIIGVGLALLLNGVDNKLRSERELESTTELPVIGSVSKMSYTTRRQNTADSSNTDLRGETIV
ncbi:hypothetical protein HXA35_11235 [Bacillus sp. A301a_S52]|nr:hypothetical protein [Bacillus sp. A301a_S52]